MLILKDYERYARAKQHKRYTGAKQHINNRQLEKSKLHNIISSNYIGNSTRDLIQDHRHSTPRYITS
jgi:hypothetical protein